MAVREAHFCMAEVRFCMGEAHGGRGFPPSFNNIVFDFIKRIKQQKTIFLQKLNKELKSAVEEHVLKVLFNILGVYVHIAYLYLEPSKELREFSFLS